MLYDEINFKDSLDVIKFKLVLWIIYMIDEINCLLDDVVL